MSVLDWRKPDEWKSAISSYANDLLNDQLIQHLQSTEISGCWSDDMSWLPDPEVVEHFEVLLRKHYSHIKCFHGARPICVSSYYDQGFVGQSRKIIEDQFRKMYSDLDASLLDKVVLEHKKRGDTEKGKIYFVCDDRDLVEDSGHYLIQGSEYIMALAASLTRYSNQAEDYRLRLRASGIPTVFEVDLLLTQIPGIQIEELVRCIIASWVGERIFPGDQCEYEMGFVVHSDVGAESIVSHFHPRRIKDPHFGGIWYYPELLSCEVCNGL